MIEGEQPAVKPTLITPYEGEIEEILGEIDHDKHGFFLEAGRRLIRENEALARLSKHAQKSSDPTFALKLFTLYYEVYSRAARKAKVPMIVVEDDIVDNWEQRRRDRMQTMFDDDLELGSIAVVGITLTEAQEEIIEERSNPEWDQFWYYMDTVEEKLDEEIESEVVPEIFYPVYILREVLKIQDGINRAEVDFQIPDSLPIE